MNPMEFLKTIKNPQKFAMDMMKQNSNPMMKNLMEMVQSGNTKQIEQFARNICKERSIDFDKEFANFMKNIKG